MIESKFDPMLGYMQSREVNQLSTLSSDSDTLKQKPEEERDIVKEKLTLLPERKVLIIRALTHRALEVGSSVHQNFHTVAFDAFIQDDFLRNVDILKDSRHEYVGYIELAKRLLSETWSQTNTSEFTLTELVLMKEALHNFLYFSTKSALKFHGRDKDFTERMTWKKDSIDNINYSGMMSFYVYAENIFPILKKHNPNYTLLSWQLSDIPKFNSWDDAPSELTAVAKPEELTPLKPEQNEQSNQTEKVILSKEDVQLLLRAVTHSALLAIGSVGGRRQATQELEDYKSLINNTTVIELQQLEKDQAKLDSLIALAKKLVELSSSEDTEVEFTLGEVQLIGSSVNYFIHTAYELAHESMDRINGKSPKVTPIGRSRDEVRMIINEVANATFDLVKTKFEPIIQKHALNIKFTRPQLRTSS